MSIPTFQTGADCECGERMRADFTPSPKTVEWATLGGGSLRESVEHGVSRVASPCPKCRRLVTWRVLREDEVS